MNPHRPIEIMSPVGSWETLAAALQAGAGSVYFGIGNLNMRARSSANFSFDDLKTIAATCREKGVQSYLTVNTVLYDEDIPEMKRIVDLAKEAGVSAIIASDMATLEYGRKTGVELHASTQLNISNFEALSFYAQYCDVVVLARELTIEQMTAICKKIDEENLCGPGGTKIRIEVFVHGALCIGISGKCYMSLHDNLHSANRGSCYQNCRRSYIVKDKETGYEMELDHEYIMSPSDLCTLPFIDKLLESGVSVLKIEGRARSPEYVKTVTECYHEAVIACQNGTFDPMHTDQWMERLKKVFNRGFWDGYYLGRKTGEWSQKYGSSATTHKEYVGKVRNYFAKVGVAEILVEALYLEKGDEILFIGGTTGVVEMVLGEFWQNDQPASRAEKTDIITVKVPEPVKTFDKVYIILPADIKR